MQDVSAQFLDALTGSFGTVLVVDSWYDGELIYADLPVTSGMVTQDASRGVTAEFTFEVASEDPLLRPRSWDAPLAPFGTEVQVRAGVNIPGNPELVSLGWYRLDTSDPDELYGRYPDTAADPKPFRGLTCELDSSDRMSYVDDARLLAPEQPPQLLSAKTEIARLIAGLIPAGEWSAITDRAIPRSTAYDESRLGAVQNLAGVLGTVARADPNGQLGLYPQAVDIVWKVNVSDDALDWSHKLTRDGIYNAVVAKGEADEVVQGVAVEDDGPLRYGGPFGQVPYGYASPLLTTDQLATAAAITRLGNLARDRVMDVEVLHVANPALELGDLITVEAESLTLTGPITKLAIPLPLGEMTTTIAVPRQQIWGLR